MRTYYLWPSVIMSAVSLCGSLLVLLNISLMPKLRTQFYQVMVALLAVADIVQFISWIVYPKYLSPYPLCMTQEYIFQGASIFKASMIGVICSVTWNVVTNMKLQSRSQFLSIAATWMIVPTLCLPLSVVFKTGNVWCTESAQDSAVIGYSFSFLLPLVACVILDFILYFKMRSVLNKLEEERATKAANPYNTKLLGLIRKLKYFPLAFGLSWTVELILVVMFLCGLESGELALFNTAAGVGICSTGLSISVIYFYHQKEHPQLLTHLFAALGRCHSRTKSIPAGSESFLSSAVSSVVSSSAATTISNPIAVGGAKARAGVLSYYTSGVVAEAERTTGAHSPQRETGMNLPASRATSSQPSMLTLDIETPGSMIMDNQEDEDTDIVE